MNTLIVGASNNPILRYAFNSFKRALLLLRPFGPILRVMFDIAAQTCFVLNKLVGWSYQRLWVVLASIEHFSIEDGARLLQRLGEALKQGGVLLGSTPIFAEIGGHNEEHQNEFLSVEQLRNFLAPHFAKIELWCSQWPKRMDCYFECREPISSLEHD